MQDIRAVLFDVYGTLVEIARRRAPYRQLIDLAESRNASLDRQKARRAIMCRGGTLREAGEQLGLALSEQEWMRLEDALHEEVESVRLYPETEQVLVELRRRGVRTALCSNLAAPYIHPVESRIGHLIDVAIWSCEVGALKPEPAIFAAVLNQLKLPPTSVVMVGDSYVADVVGATNVGMRALHVDRLRGQGDIASLLDVLKRVS